jgi:hypothetical protein
MVMSKKWFNLCKGLSTHIACYKGDFLLFRDPGSLEHKVQVLFNKPVFQLTAVTILELGLGYSST